MDFICHWFPKANLNIGSGLLLFNLGHTDGGGYVNGDIAIIELLGELNLKNGNADSKKLCLGIVELDIGRTTDAEKTMDASPRIFAPILVPIDIKNNAEPIIQLRIIDKNNRIKHVQTFCLHADSSSEIFSSIQSKTISITLTTAVNIGVIFRSFVDTIEPKDVNNSASISNSLVKSAANSFSNILQNEISEAAILQIQTTSISTAQNSSNIRKKITHVPPAIVSKFIKGSITIFAGQQIKSNRSDAFEIRETDVQSGTAIDKLKAEISQQTHLTIGARVSRTLSVAPEFTIKVAHIDRSRIMNSFKQKMLAQEANNSNENGGNNPNSIFGSNEHGVTQEEIRIAESGVFEFNLENSPAEIGDMFVFYALPENYEIFLQNVDGTLFELQRSYPVVTLDSKLQLTLSYSNTLAPQQGNMLNQNTAHYEPQTLDYIEKERMQRHSRIFSIVDDVVMRQRQEVNQYLIPQRQWPIYAEEFNLPGLFENVAGREKPFSSLLIYLAILQLDKIGRAVGQRTGKSIKGNLKQDAYITTIAQSGRKEIYTSIIPIIMMALNSDHNIWIGKTDKYLRQNTEVQIATLMLGAEQVNWLTTQDIEVRYSYVLEILQTGFFRANDNLSILAKLEIPLDFRAIGLDAVNILENITPGKIVRWFSLRDMSAELDIDSLPFELFRAVAIDTACTIDRRKNNGRKQSGSSSTPNGGTIEKAINARISFAENGYQSDSAKLPPIAYLDLLEWGRSFEESLIMCVDEIIGLQNLFDGFIPYQGIALAYTNTKYTRSKLEKALATMQLEQWDDCAKRIQSDLIGAKEDFKIDQVFGMGHATLKSIKQFQSDAIRKFSNIDLPSFFTILDKDIDWKGELTAILMIEQSAQPGNYSKEVLNQANNLLSGNAQDESPIIEFAEFVNNLESVFAGILKLTGQLKQKGELPDFERDADSMRGSGFNIQELAKLIAVKWLVRFPNKHPDVLLDISKQLSKISKPNLPRNEQETLVLLKREIGELQNGSEFPAKNIIRRMARTHDFLVKHQ